MIIALAGSPRSSSGPARKSRERLRASASDSLSSVALAVAIPHPVFVLMAALTGSLSLTPGPLAPGLPAPGSLPPGSPAPGSLTPGSLTPDSPADGGMPADGETPADGGMPAEDAPASPAVLVYVPSASATEALMASVSCASTKRCPAPS